MSKFANYQVNDSYKAIADDKLVDFSPAAIAVGGSNKLKPQELCELNGTEYITQANGVVTYDNGQIVINLCKTKDNQKQWTKLLSTLSIPDQVKSTRILFTRVEADGGDLFIIDGGEVVGRYEVKAGKTKKGGMPINSHTSAFQLVHGEFPHAVRNGYIVVDITSTTKLTKKDKVAKMLVTTIIRLFGSVDGLIAANQEAERKLTTIKQSNAIFEQIPVVYMDKSAGTIETYLVNDAEIAPRYMPK